MIVYDQLGCGASALEAPHPSDMFTVDLFVAEIDAVRDALGLERVILLGHSWGGTLALAYALTQPPGLEALIVQSASASYPYWLTELDRLRGTLPNDVESTLRRHEADGTTDTRGYRDAAQVFYDRHLCRVPYPWWLDRCFEAMAREPEVYEHMNGPSEFHVTGTLRDLDIEDGLRTIRVPTLLFCGRHDEVTPATVRRVHDRIVGSRFVVLPRASHMAQAEQPAETFALVEGFVRSLGAHPPNPR